MLFAAKTDEGVKVGLLYFLVVFVTGEGAPGGRVGAGARRFWLPPPLGATTPLGTGREAGGAVCFPH